MKAMKKAMASGAIVAQVAGEDGVEAEAGARGVRRAPRGCLRRGGQDGAVHDPAAGEAEVEAQARTEGRHKDDVRKGGAGGSEARQQGGQGLPRQGPEGLHLRPLPGASSAAPEATRRCSAARGHATPRASPRSKERRSGL